MEEKQLREDSHVTEYIRLHNFDVEELYLRRGEYVEGPCPACAQSNVTFRFEKSGFNFVACNLCGTLYINPRPTRQMLDKFYADASSFRLFNDKIYPISENARRDLIFRPRAEKVIDLCRKYNIPTGTFVEVGAGFGTFSEEIQKMGVFNKVIAIEPSRDLAKTCREKGLDVVEKSIEDADLLGANVVACFEVIEHLYWPKDFLMACARVLDDGLLILTTPNIYGFDLQILGIQSENIDGPEHLNYFNPKSLKHLVEPAGLKVLEIETPGKLDAELVRKKILSGEYDVAMQPFLKQVLIDEWESAGGPFQQFLSDNKLSSHMWLVAKKSN